MMLLNGLNKARIGLNLILIFYILDLVGNAVNTYKVKIIIYIIILQNLCLQQMVCTC